MILKTNNFGGDDDWQNLDEENNDDEIDDQKIGKENWGNALDGSEEEDDDLAS